jgi:hypothetical protein
LLIYGTSLVEPEKENTGQEPNGAVTALIVAVDFAPANTVSCAPAGPHQCKSDATSGADVQKGVLHDGLHERAVSGVKATGLYMLLLFYC